MAVVWDLGAPAYLVPFRQVIATAARTAYRSARSARHGSSRACIAASVREHIAAQASGREDASFLCRCIRQQAVVAADLPRNPAPAAAYRLVHQRETLSERNRRVVGHLAASAPTCNVALVSIALPPGERLHGGIPKFRLYGERETPAVSGRGFDLFSVSARPREPSFPPMSPRSGRKSVSLEARLVSIIVALTRVWRSYRVPCSPLK